MDTVKGVLHDVKNEVGVVIGFTNIFIDALESNDAVEAAIADDKFLQELPGRAKLRLEQCVSRIEILEKSLVYAASSEVEILRVKDQVVVIRECAEAFDLRVMTDDLDHSAKCEFFANSVGLQRVVKNLIENAKKAQAVRLFIEASVSEHTVQLILKDNGLGMTELQIQELGFGYSGTEDGTGIGTEIIRYIVSSFGGYVHWSSIPQLGTCCAITFRKANQGTGEGFGPKATPKRKLPNFANVERRSQ